MSWREYKTDAELLAAYYLGVHNSRNGRTVLKNITRIGTYSHTHRERQAAMNAAARQGFQDHCDGTTEMTECRTAPPDPRETLLGPTARQRLLQRFDKTS